MKEYDQVRLIKDREIYTEKGIHIGMSGTIIWNCSVNGKWLVNFDGEFKQSKNGVWYTTDVECEVREEDLEVVSEL